MRNKFFKGAHLSEKDVKKILVYFCEDLTATEIASITSISRVTINNYLRLIREQIGQLHVQTKVPQRTGVLAEAGGYDDELCDKNQPVFYSVQLLNQQVRVCPLESRANEIIHTLRSGQPILEGPDYYQRNMSDFDAYIDPENWRLMRVDPTFFVLKKNRGVGDDIDTFWTLAKNRLSKFRGLNRNSIHLHLIECAFRYNYRNQNLYDVLYQHIRLNPLNQQ